MKIKKQYHDRVLNVSHDFIPGGIKKRLGDLKVSEVRALHKLGFISDVMLEKSETKKKKEDEHTPDSSSDNL